MNTSRVTVLGMGLLLTVGMCVGCNTRATPERVEAKPAPSVAVAVAVQAPSVVAQPVAAPVVIPATAIVASVPTPVRTAQISKHAEESLKVKRFVVGSGVKDREPLLGTDALPSDGSAIYAFAELSNVQGESENVRITFERKGGTERVGDVSLAVPGNVARHRTWAFTRFIRSAGVWEAVLWSESGVELGRTSFEVAGA